MHTKEINSLDKQNYSLNKVEENRRFRWQLFVFVFTYISYSMLHFIRQGWSIQRQRVHSSTLDAVYSNRQSNKKRRPVSTGSDRTVSVWLTFRSWSATRRVCSSADSWATTFRFDWCCQQASCWSALRRRWSASAGTSGSLAWRTTHCSLRFQGSASRSGGRHISLWLGTGFLSINEGLRLGSGDHERILEILEEIYLLIF